MCHVNPSDVTLAWSTLTDAQLQELMLRCLQLTNLNLSGCRQLTRPCAWTAFARPPLVSLNLSFIPALSDACIRGLEALQGTLQALSLGGAGISSTAVAALVTSLHRLEELDVYQCMHLDDSAFTGLSVGTLRVLDARFTGMCVVVC